MAVVYPFGVFVFYTFVLCRRRQLLYPTQVRGRPKEDKAIAEEAKRLNELALQPFAILHDACEQSNSACVVLRNVFVAPLQRRVQWCSNIQGTIQAAPEVQQNPFISALHISSIALR